MRRVRSRVISTAIVAGSIIAACKYTTPEVPGDGNTPNPDMFIQPPECTAEVHECLDNGSGMPVQLHECAGANATPQETVCPWGCIETGTTAHCGLLQPTGALQGSDLVPPQQPLKTAAIDLPADFNTTDGSISGLRAAGSGLVDNIQFEVRGGVAIWRLQKLTVNAPSTIDGDNAAAIVAFDGITFNAPLDARGDCLGPGAGPGGFLGGLADLDGGGPAGGAGAGIGGTGTDDHSSGGGGGAFGGAGGSGGSGSGTTTTDGGTTFGDAAISILQGGGGGGGGGNGGGVGGGGGGDGGGATSGEKGNSSTSKANGGNGGAKGGDGGDGGDDGSADGGNGSAAENGGGGGGGVGWIRINTPSGAATLTDNAVTSPTLGAVGASTATQSTVVIQ